MIAVYKLRLSGRIEHLHRLKLVATYLYGAWLMLFTTSMIEIKAVKGEDMEAALEEWRASRGDK